MSRRMLSTVALACLPAVCLAAGAVSPLEDLVPRPVRIERRSGERPPVGVRFVRGEVPGAPAAVREEAYVLDVAADGITVTACDPREVDGLTSRDWRGSAPNDTVN